MQQFIASSILVTILSFQGETVATESLEELISTAERYYEKREDAKNLTLAIETLKGAVHNPSTGSGNKSEARLYVLLAKCYFKLSEYHTPDKEDKEKLLKEVQRYAREAIARDGEVAGGYYWLGVSLGKRGALHPFRFKGSDDMNTFKEVITEALKKDPTYDFGGPDRALAAYHMPQHLGFVKFWGDREKAVRHAQTAVKINTHYLWNHLILARVLWHSGERDEALEKLKWLSEQETSNLPEAAFENNHVKAKVQQYLKEYSETKRIHW